MIVIGNRSAIKHKKLGKLRQLGRNENGSRAELFASNLHSNGEDFSRS